MNPTWVTSKGQALIDPTPPTPWEVHGGYHVKRDDLYEVAGVQGGKVRTCWYLANAGRDRGCDTLVTAGSRSSPQVNIVAQVGAYLGMATIAYTPQGELAAELLAAKAAGCDIVQVKAGYNSVIRARARNHAEAHPEHCVHVPFGMECPEAVVATARQCLNLPRGLTRLVVPVGSGMSLAGVLHGLDCYAPYHGGPSQVLAVCVGADPSKRLDKWAPPDWRFRVQLVRAPQDYASKAERATLGGLVLDPIYEAKCLPYLEPGDGLWVVGVRQHTEVAA